MENRPCRPPVLPNETYRIQTGCGNFYITLVSDEKGLCEVFLKMGKAGGCATAQVSAIGQVISIALWSVSQRRGKKEGRRNRAEVVNWIIEQLEGIKCHQPYPDGALSCADAIGKVLREWKEGVKAQEITAYRAVCNRCGERTEKDTLQVLEEDNKWIRKGHNWYCPDCAEELF